jgi:hypothetical protein
MRGLTTGGSTTAEAGKGEEEAVEPWVHPVHMD